MLQKIENPKMLRIEFWTFVFDVKKCSKRDPGTLIIGFALKNYAHKWSQVVQTLDNRPQTDDFGIFARSERTRL